MILYFSATGNCEHVAKELARKTDDVAHSMVGMSREISLKDGEQLGIVIPTYFWGLPSYVEEFMREAVIRTQGEHYVYCVASYGTTTGQIDYFLNRLLKEKGVSLSASYSIKTVDNWTVLFSVADEEKNGELLASEAEQLKQVIADVEARRNQFIKKDKKALWLCKGARHFYDKARQTSHLHVLENCISCGLCARDCPVRAIEMINGKPTWVKERCAMCFRCLHRCPAFAIQYDNKTQKNGQYVHPKSE